MLYAVYGSLTLHTCLQPNRKRKRSEAKPSRVQDSPADSRAFISLKSCAVQKKDVASGFDNSKTHSINHWIQRGNWPRKYFRDSEMNILLARKRSSSLRHKQSEYGSTTHSADTLNDQKARDLKTAPYKDPQYGALLAAQGSYMNQSHLGISDTSTSLCQTLLNSDQVTPTYSLFHDDLFYETCLSVQSRNEARIIRDITPLICPSAEVLAIHNYITPNLLTDGVDQGWNNSIPITKVRPQPDYSVGFSQSAFSKGQISKLSPYIGGLYDASFFMATFFMHFPFLTCETKSGVAGLDIADRQNAHSMTLAVRGVVELFRLAKREDEVHQRILAFSISHDATTVRIYGHYPLIDGNDTTYYRHPFRSYDLTDQEGKERWTAYRFTMSIYSVFMPEHLERIRSAVDAIPADMNFEISSNHPTPSEKESESCSVSSSLQGMAEISPVVEGAEPSKNPKLRPKVMLQQEIDYLKQQLAQEREEKKRLLEMLQKK